MSCGNDGELALFQLDEFDAVSRVNSQGKPDRLGEGDLAFRGHGCGSHPKSPVGIEYSLLYSKDCGLSISRPTRDGMAQMLPQLRLVRPSHDTIRIPARNFWSRSVIHV